MADRQRWLIDGNNTFGSKPDGWWNDRAAAMVRFTQAVAEWCRTHGDDVVLVFDRPVPDEAFELAGGNLTVVAAKRRGRNAADDTIVDMCGEGNRVVSSDKGLRERLPDRVDVLGVGAFRELVGY